MSSYPNQYSHIQATPRFHSRIADNLDTSSQSFVEMPSSTSSSPTSPTPKPGPWETKLIAACAARGIIIKSELVSEMRGGRTAWAAVVYILGLRIQGRYWFEGIPNAKEDAAEVALKLLLKYWPLPSPFSKPQDPIYYLPTTPATFITTADTNRPAVMSSNE